MRHKREFDSIEDVMENFIALLGGEEDCFTPVFSIKMIKMHTDAFRVHFTDVCVSLHSVVR